MEVVSPSGSLEVKVVYPKELSSLVPVCYYQPVEEPLPIMWASTVGQAGSLSSSMRFGWGSIIFALKKSKVEGTEMLGYQQICQGNGDAGFLVKARNCFLSLPFFFLFVWPGNKTHHEDTNKNQRSLWPYSYQFILGNLAWPLSMRGNI